jgi:hypothetical protein
MEVSETLKCVKSLKIDVNGILKAIEHDNYENIAGSV